MPTQLPPHARACLALCESVAEQGRRMPAAVERKAFEAARELIERYGRPPGKAYERRVRFVTRGLSKERKKRWEQLLLEAPLERSPGGNGEAPVTEPKSPRTRSSRVRRKS